MGQLRILIAGAGIGGLTLAALLRQRGVVAEVVERAPNFDHAGYMLALYPLGSRVLHGLGLFGKFRETSAMLEKYAVYNGHSELIHDYDLGEISRRFGHLGQLKRAELLELLRSAAPDVPLRFNAALETLDDRGDEIIARTSDGHEGAYDLVVGADGIHSAARRNLFGAQPDTATGWGLWMWWGDALPVPHNLIQEYWGAGRFVGVYPTRTAVGLIASGPVEEIGPAALQGDGARLRAAFGDLRGAVQAVLATFPARTDGLFFWNLADFRATHWVKGRVALLGDAACAFLPTAGIGASMAMESAAVLADELGRTDARGLPLALELYEKRRQKRAQGAQDDSRKLAATMLVKSLPLAWGRDQLLKVYSLEMMLKNISRSLGEPL